jgi:hypothetical protein
LRDFFAMVVRRGAWRLPVFFGVAGASDSGEGWFKSSVFFFFGTGVSVVK